jgi:Tfp pilus assembly protein PilF
MAEEVPDRFEPTAAVTQPISPESWERVKAGLERTLELNGTGREQYLADLERNAPEEGRLVRELLKASEEEGFSSPPWRPVSGEGARIGFSKGQLLNDRYDIEDHIGTGGAGEVYRAYDRHRGIRVALKAVRFASAGEQGAVAALRNEVNTASLVSHPNVCRLYDINIPAPGSGDPPFITMELLSGETLAERLERGKIVPEAAYKLVVGILAGLEAAHSRGIVHCDLKPGNVMLEPDNGEPRPVILDFGIAQCWNPVDTVRSILAGEWCAGTPAYMSPEVLEGKKATPASDIHSLGVMMFEMVTGRRPFEGDTPMAIALRRMTREAPRARSYQPQLDRRWDHAISRCLQRNPEDRPQTAAEVKLLLDRRAPRKWNKRIAAIGAVAASLAVFQAIRPHPVSAIAQADLDNARVAMRNQSREGFETAIRELKDAIKSDPHWAEPWAELAYAYAAGSNARFVDDKLAISEARTAALEAIKLNPKLAQAYAALGWTQSLDFDNWPKAEESFRAALKLSREDARIRYWFAVHLRKKGRFHEAESQLQTAMELTHRQDANIWSELAFLYWTSGQYSRMRDHMTEQLVTFPNFAATRYLNARLLKLEGKYAEAERELAFSEALGLNPLTVLVERASLSAFRGDRTRAYELLAGIERMGRMGQVDGLLIAGVWAKLGDLNRAFSSLNAAYERRDNTLLSMATSPVLAPLRRDPRFSMLLAKLHFTPQIMQQMEFSSSSASEAARQPSRTGTS